MRCWSPVARTKVMSLLPGRPDLAAAVRFAGVPRSCRVCKAGERAVDILRYRTLSPVGFTFTVATQLRRHEGHARSRIVE